MSALADFKAVLARPASPAHTPHQQWIRSMQRMLFWFVGGILLTRLLSALVPGNIILVGTESIPRGLYWLDTRPAPVTTGEYVSFTFAPPQHWISSRYGGSPGMPKVFTKAVGAIEGDTVFSDAAQLITACHPMRGAAAPGDIPSPIAHAGMDCEIVGKVQTADSKGRGMTGWLAPNSSYTLRAGELWAFGPHPKSLDSRYFGPIRAADINGIASPLYTLK